MIKDSKVMQLSPLSPTTINYIRVKVRFRVKIRVRGAISQLGLKPLTTARIGVFFITFFNFCPPAGQIYQLGL